MNTKPNENDPEIDFSAIKECDFPKSYNLNGLILRMKSIVYSTSGEPALDSFEYKNGLIQRKIID